ncbi:MAG: hypothetical protein Q8P24_12890, partial [Desulfobacterales bacterium]|nr:hypothetical protein [Desulfobacterales bacterium]
YHIVCGMPRNQVKKVQVYGESKSLGIVFPEPVPVGAGELIYVPEKSEHPNAAILFVAWTSTREAQNILDDVDFTGHPHFEGNEINEVLKGKRVVYSMWRDVAHADAILAELFQAMGMPVVRGEAKKKK